MKSHRPSRRFLKDKRWPALRLEALRRDSWRCVVCGSKVRLEVDHIEPTRDRPDLAFSLDNLQVLCAAHHTAKTRKDIGLPEKSAERLAWEELLRNTK